MKRLIAAALSYVMLLVLLTPALAAEGKPAPPPWIKAEEYTVFSGDKAYEKENWEQILKLRADAAAGHLEPKEGDALYSSWKTLLSTPGWYFELGLIGMKYGENAADHRATKQASTYFAYAQNKVLDLRLSYNDPDYQLMSLWYQRAFLLGSGKSFFAVKFWRFLENSPYAVEDFRAYPGMSHVTEAEWAVIEAAKASAQKTGTPQLWLDGHSICNAVVRNGCTMVPVRTLAELLGGEVSYVSATKAIRITRAGTEILMPIGKTAATVNGKTVQMLAAPYMDQGTTYVPAGNLAEFLGQKIEWVGQLNCASVMENKGAAGTSNLEAWALPMGAVQNYLRGNPTRFGGRERYVQIDTGVYDPALRRTKSIYAYEQARELLRDSWSIEGRKDLIETVCSMTTHGHNDSFLRDVAMIKGWSQSEYQQVLNSATGMDKYMFPYTKELGEKWGSRGILCWDLFRMSNLVQWGYEAGYLTYPEALALLEPAAKLLRDNFKNWDEAYNNYLDGYYWWAREDMQGKDPWKDGSRGQTTSIMLRSYRDRLLDDRLFQKPVSGVPGLTAEQLLASVESAA